MKNVQIKSLCHFVNGRTFFSCGKCSSLSKDVKVIAPALTNQKNNSIINNQEQCKANVTEKAIRLQHTSSADFETFFGDEFKKSSRTRLYHRIKRYIKHEKDAEDFVKHLKEQERQLLLAALENHNIAVNGIENGADEPVSSYQLRLVFMNNCIPFVGFGFLDNAVMICAGEYIDLTIGVTLGITTMAAAALGNLVSDMAGIGLAGYVEALCGKLGMPVAQITPEQAEQPGPRYASYSGKGFGIALGCIIGMFPLLFAREKPCDTCEKHECSSDGTENVIEIEGAKP